MRVYHDAEGRIRFTMRGNAGIAPPGQFLEIEETDLGDLAGWRVMDGALVRPEGWADAALASSRLAAVARINTAAGTVRRRYVTDIPGQEALYLLKEAEARAWLAEAEPDPVQYPLIAAEIGITAPTGDEVAQVYLNLGALYVTAAAQLETARLGHIAIAETAPTPEAAGAAADAFELLIQGQIGGAP